jgi:DNA-binding MarR family transcriptional regulator
MNNNRESKTEQYRSLQILGEIASDKTLTQRDLSNKLGIALGLVNSYIKNLIKKGFIKVTSMPPRKYVYLLTPAGLTEKTRLTYQLLKDYNRIFREARASLKRLFAEIGAEGVQRVVFAGTDEVAEIAYITLQEIGIELTGVVDIENTGQNFYGHKIKTIRDIAEMECDCVVLASFWSGKRLYDELVRYGVPESGIKAVFPL